MGYRRLTFEDRCQIFAFQKAGWTITEIGQQLGVHRTTIWLELRKNGGKDYRPKKADELAKALGKRRVRKKLMDDPKIAAAVKAGLAKGFSPEQISGRMRRESGLMISHGTIYTYLKKKDRT